MDKLPITRKDIATAAAIALAGAVLGLAVNAVSPKGFNFMIASGLRQAALPSTDWDDEPAKPGVQPVPAGQEGRP